MYKTCMFCAKPLGANAVVESFPVGRRLAFDAERGRLWVVCRKCERWNLTPIEERWEAVEDCERIFRGTRLRVSTENIGLARHPEGLTLVRIGSPMRPEFAAWRYGDQFGRRMGRRVLYGSGAAVVGTAFVVSGAGAALFSSGIGMGASCAYLGWRYRRTAVKLHPDKGKAVKLRARDLKDTRIGLGDTGEGFSIRVGEGRTATWHHGDEARRFAGAILPMFNGAGGTRRTVQGAVGEIETAGHPEAFVDGVAWSYRDLPGYVNQLPRLTKLALEMALHEEQERRAMEGELWLLERAWQEAEEIAAISDSLLLPDGAEDFVREHAPPPSAPKPAPEP